MALPGYNVPSLKWNRYNNSETNLIVQYGLDFTTYGAYTITPNGTVNGSTVSSNVSADGVNINNIANPNPVTVQVGSTLTEVLPAYTKSTIILGGTPPVVTISSPSGQCTATFFKGTYPGAFAQTDVLGATKGAIAVYLAPGIMMMYGGLVGNVPDGWLLCDGSALSRITYADLFAAIGTAFGAGDGASTFNVPDMRGNFPRGWSAGSTVDPGRVFGSLQASQIQSHYHRTVTAFDGNGHFYGFYSAGAPGYGYDQSTLNLIQVTANATYFSGTANFARTDYGVGYNKPDNTPIVDGSETRPRNVALNFIIKT